MKIIIVYAGKTGTTKECANILADKLNDVLVIDLVKDNPDISSYDLIIIGSSIRMGMMQASVKKFIKENKELLKTKKTAYYICCAFPENTEENFKRNIPNELLEKAITYDCFGGTMDLSKQKGFDKFVVNMISKSPEGKREIKILEDNINQFANKINDYMLK